MAPERSTSAPGDDPPRAAWERARTAWPTVEVPLADFAHYIEARRPAGVAAGPFLAQLCAGDLYLCCACLRGDGTALQAFERTHLAQVPAFLGDMAKDQALVDEVKQGLRERLLVGEAPQLSGYTGRGALHMWLRVTALRAAWKLRGRGAAREATELAPDDALQGGVDPELRYLKERYQEDFQQALRDGFLQLTSRQRNLLRLRHLQGLTDEKIGAAYQVHQSTVTRWMAALHGDLLQETRRLLRERLRLSPAEFDSLAALVQSQLQLSLGGLLRASRG